ncbi:MAG: TRAP transporter small permease [Deltaproteobacteria bacterium]|jgi:C4-dicarboxylate transporter DctQ subunit|nr:TRAP transporter small permease [Deltaproteobacteria bacterium]
MKSLQRALDKAETAIVTTTLGIMTVVIFMQVFFRTAGGLESFCAVHGIEHPAIRAATLLIFKTSIGVISWTEELARYMMVWTVFIGGAIGAKTGAHVGLEAFVNLFPTRMVRAALVVSGVISASFSLFVSFHGFFLARRIIGTGQVSPALELPMGLVYAAVPVGSLLMAGHFLFAGLEKYSSFSGQAKKEG